jgi:hypothetical protein
MQGERAISSLVQLCLIKQNQMNERLAKVVNKALAFGLDFIPSSAEIAHFLH